MAIETVQLKQIEVPSLKEATVETQTQLEGVVRGINPVIVPILLSARRTAKMYTEPDLRVIPPAYILEESDCCGIDLNSRELIKGNLRHLSALELAFDACSQSYAGLIWRKYSFLRQIMAEEELVDYTRALVKHVFSWKLAPEELCLQGNVDQLIIRVFGFLDKIPQRLAAERPYFLTQIDELEDFIEDPYNLNPERVVENREETAEFLAFVQKLDENNQEVMIKALKDEEISYKEKRMAQKTLLQNPRFAALVNSPVRQKSCPAIPRLQTREKFGITDASGTSVFANLTPRQSIWLILSELTTEQRWAVLGKLGYMPLPLERRERQRIACLVYDAKKVLLEIREELDDVPRFEGQLADVLGKSGGEVCGSEAGTGKNQRLLRALFALRPELLGRLEGRQKEVASLFAAGRSVVQIAESLQVSPATVNWVIWKLAQVLN